MREAREGKGEGLLIQSAIFSLGVSSYSLSPCFSSYICLSLSYYCFVHHPDPFHCKPLLISSSLPPFHISPLPLPFLSCSLPIPSPLPPSSPPSLRIGGPGAGSDGGLLLRLCAPTSVYSDNRDWERAARLPHDIHRDFIKSILKNKNHVRPNSPPARGLALSISNPSNDSSRLTVWVRTHRRVQVVWR